MCIYLKEKAGMETKESQKLDQIYEDEKQGEKTGVATTTTNALDEVESLPLSLSEQKANNNNKKEEYAETEEENDCDNNTTPTATYQEEIEIESEKVNNKTVAIENGKGGLIEGENKEFLEEKDRIKD